MTASSFIYCIQNAAGEIKVGRSRDPERRRRDLQVSSAATLRLVWERRVPAEIVGRAERHLHALLNDLSLGGEWFAATPEIALDAFPEALRMARSKSPASRRRATRAIVLGSYSEPFDPWADDPLQINRVGMTVEERRLEWREYSLGDPPPGFDDWYLRRLTPSGGLGAWAIRYVEPEAGA